MNCFNNNTPNLSASERTQNVRARNLYNAAKQDFQTRGRCRDYAGKTGFYRESGQLRNTSSYCSFLDLNRGYALCVDGAADPSLPSLHDISGQSIYRGLGACGGRSDDLGNPVKLVNGRDNIFNVFTGTDWSAGALLVAGFSYDTLLKGFPVIKTFPPPLLDPSMCCLVDNLLLPFTNEVDVSFNMLNYPALNNDGAGVVIDPSNILFGADFCPTDAANRTQGPNKYLLFAHTSNLVQLSGQLWSVGPALPAGPGVLIKCGDPAIRVGLTVVAGVGIATGNLTSIYGGVTWRNWFMSNYTTAWGIVERLCCGTGPNGEPHWWTLYIKGASGTIAPQELLPLRVRTTGSGNADAAVLAMKGGSGGTGGHFIELGGIWKGGTVPRRGSQSQLRKEPGWWRDRALQWPNTSKGRRTSGGYHGMEEERSRSHKVADAFPPPRPLDGELG